MGNHKTRAVVFYSVYKITHCPSRDYWIWVYFE